jgi:cellulose synthase/poly-beta-1,6-N-acetylglucosamine synthase-like glycosyltransferase
MESRTPTHALCDIPAIEEKLDPAAMTRRRESLLTWAGILLTLVATLLVAVDLARFIAEDLQGGDWAAIVAHAAVSFIIAFLIYGGLVYQFARLAFIRRLRAHQRATPPDSESVYQRHAPSVCVLVPSYKEERAVVRMTLLSAALQDYPSRRVVLLLDDPPRAASPLDQAGLDAMRQLPAEIESLFAAPRHQMQIARAAYWERISRQQFNAQAEYRTLSSLYAVAAEWVGRLVDEHQAGDHAHAVFADKVLRRHQQALLCRASALRSLADTSTDSEPAARAGIDREYNRLVGLFSVQLSIFERKRYQNLSHEPNKAMNLNSYLGLMGKRVREISAKGGLVLEEVAEGGVGIPWADYVITLDADSLLLTDYAQRLVHLMEQPGNERLAVVQTPYSAYSGAPGVLERIAGATTDIQYIIHQGFSGYGATYWVGANALLRRTALEDIVESDVERDFPTKRYIQDRTVIEDTESTIDLVAKGWQLHNYPERLAYSATPPDFGSLLIQRRRWANGGLLILPKLLRHLAGRTRGKPSLGEGFMRLHYLSSIAAVNVGLLVLLAFPLTSDLDSVWLPLTALPYFFLYGRDLVKLGYRWTDLVRVYALNLLLIPINLGGVLTSLKQAVMKSKIPFGRTPKVQGRTAAPALYIAAEYALVIHWLLGAGFDIAEQRWLHGLFSLINALLLGYAIVHLMGLKASLEDVRGQWGLVLQEKVRALPALARTGSGTFRGGRSR